MIAILKHVPEEGPGSLERYLIERSLPYRIFETLKGDAPSSLDGITRVILLGGPMGVYERDRYPHLRCSLRLIEGALRAEIPILGICLGSQLLAHALGGRVYKGHGEEIGWRDIELTQEGLEDPALRALALNPLNGAVDRAFTVFHWHGDTFDLPEGSVHLARSTMYPHQAFRYGNRVYAFQFHIEVTEGMLLQWFQNAPSGKTILLETQTRIGEYARRSEQFYQSFFFLGTCNDK